MPTLDIRTLSFLAMLTSVLLAVGLQLVNRVIKRDPALRFWAMGSTALGVGFVLLKWMRARANFNRVPFIMVSSNTDNHA